MSVLDRHLGIPGLRAWALLLALGTFLIVLGDFVAQMGFYVGALAGGRGRFFVAYYGCLLPRFVAIWLPLSVLAAALFTAAPLLRQGTLMALSASGIPPRRVFAAFIVLALGVCVLAFAVADQAVPALDPLAERAYARLKQDKRLVLNERFRAVAWREGATRWSSMLGLPAAGTYHMVNAFRPLPGGGWHAASARVMAWDEARGWRLKEVDVASGDRAVSLAECSPSEAGLEFARDREDLALVLRPDDSRSGAELRASGSPRFGQILCDRLAWSLLPLLCLLWGLPAFLRFELRQRPAAAAVRALGWAAIPAAGLLLLSRLLVSAGGYPWPLTAGVCGTLLALGWARWHRMRL